MIPRHTQYMHSVARHHVPSYAATTITARYLSTLPDTSSFPETRQATKFRTFLTNGIPTDTRSWTSNQPVIPPPTPTELSILLDSAMTTFQLHIQSRLASSKGKGFYTIGPCGEELTAIWGVLLKPDDSSALHYRHLASQIARLLKSGRTLPDIILDRARGYSISTLDPVTGGRHCALGGTPNDYYVTSTLASQSTPAVGRALAGSLCRTLKLPNAPPVKSVISFVSIGDGSANNAHFLSAKNLAEYAAFRGMIVPVLFTITDNNLCISLRGHHWIDQYVKTCLMPVVIANGQDPIDVWQKSTEAFNHVRHSQKPSLLLLRNVVRRFGHAATDRQVAYLSPQEIETMENTSPMESLCSIAVNTGMTTFAQLFNRWLEIEDMCVKAFDMASTEPKYKTREEVARNMMAPFPLGADSVQASITTIQGKSYRDSSSSSSSNSTYDTMRKLMTQEIGHVMRSQQDVIYVGEDVRHGGYYMVSENLAQEFPARVLDFPPDETSLLGACHGMSQKGLVVVCEIPYAKYLDCGFDMFTEICATHWLTNGKQRAGMVIRIQGFDRGVFGGNYHTSNEIRLVPGSDVLCFSNGRDWVQGFRTAIAAAREGRIVVLMDSTELLTRRHVIEHDNAWLCSNVVENGVKSTTFGDVVLYATSSDKNKKVPVIVTYGTGVPIALALRERLGRENVDVVDSPYLSSPSRALQQLVRETNNRPILFADPCKLNGSSPLAGIAATLKSDGVLSVHRPWNIVGASPSYNPLGCTLTFLNEQDMMRGLDSLK